jgi:hypothetical protein
VRSAVILAPLACATALLDCLGANCQRRPHYSQESTKLVLFGGLEAFISESPVISAVVAKGAEHTIINNFLTATHL